MATALQIQAQHLVPVLMPVAHAEAWLRKATAANGPPPGHKRQRAGDENLLALLRADPSASNQSIVDAVRAAGLGASFGRVDRLRRKLRRAARKA